MGNFTLLESGWRGQLRYHVSFGCHDEIVYVKSVNSMRPPIDGYLAPFSHDTGVVVFAFG
jgi:hypothetical protein